MAAYQQKKDMKNVEKVLKYKDALEPKDPKDVSPLGDREGKLLSIQLKLDAAQDLKEEGKPGWQATASEQLKPLDDLKWNVDSIFAIAEVEQARAFYILDRFDDALKKLQNPNTVQILNGFDDAFKREKMASSAPSVHAAFVEGLVYRAQGDKAAGDEDKVKLYSKALGKFYWIISNHTGFPKLEKVIGCFSDVDRKLRGLGKNPKYPKEVMDRLNSTISFRKKEADRLFSEGKFAQAIPIYIEELRKSKKGDSGADNLAMLSYSYIKTEKPLEAMAVAWYLGEYFPKYSKTSGALLQVGEYLWSKNEFDDALVLYRYYLKSCPTDQYAGAISARVAKLFYDKAAEAGKAARALPPGPQKSAKNAEARQAFIDAIPYYQNIIDNFQHTDYGRSAFYLLGLCHYNSRNYLKAADAFLKFCDMESKMPKEKIQLGDIADSKLRAAESCFQHAGVNDKEAKALKEKLMLIEAAHVPAADAASLPPAEEQKAPEAPQPEEQPEEPKTAEAGKDSKEMAPDELKKKIEELDAEARKYYTEAIRHCDEFVKMTAQGGILASDTSKKTVAAKENASSLVGWSYDGLKDKEKAIAALKKFADSYPDGKQTPAAMQRLGILYGETGKFDESSKVLEKLSSKFPESREGKQAMPMLAKSMYEIGNYAKSIEVFKKMIDQKAEISIFDLRWALDNLSDCKGTRPKEGSELALAAGRMLLEKIEKPVMEDWLGKARAAQMANDPKAQKAVMTVLREKITYDCAEAAFYAENPKDAIQYLDTLLKNDNTPYYYDAKFLRAKAYRIEKNYPKALSDYGDVGLTANVAKTLSVYYKAQCMIAETFMEQNEFKKATSSIDMIAATDMDAWNQDERTKALSIEERAGQMEWMEHAVHLAAVCYSKLGDKEAKGKMVEKYKRYFPKGKFLAEIEKL